MTPFPASEEYKRLTAFFSVQPSGAELSWIEIEAATGVDLGVSLPTREQLGNRQKARKAAVKAGHPGTRPMPMGGGAGLGGWGLKLATASEAVCETGRRLHKSVRAAARAHKYAGACLTTFSGSLSETDVKRLEHTVHNTASVMQAARGNVRILGRRPDVVDALPPMLPKQVQPESDTYHAEF